MVKYLDIFLKDYLEFFDYLIYLVILFLAYWKKRLMRYSILLVYYLAVTLLLIHSMYVAPAGNNWNYNLIFLLTVIALSWYFRLLFTSEAKRRMAMTGLVLNVLVFIYYEMMKKHFFSDYNSYVVGFSFVTIVGYTLAYFHQIMLDAKEEAIVLDFDFWLVCGYLAYFLGAFFMIVHYRDAELFDRGKMWSIQSIVLLFSAAITVRGYITAGKRDKS